MVTLVAALRRHERGLSVRVPPVEVSACPNQAAELADGPAPGAPVQRSVCVLVAGRHEVDIDSSRDVRHRTVLTACEGECVRGSSWWRRRRAGPASIGVGVGVGVVTTRHLNNCFSADLLAGRL